MGRVSGFNHFRTQGNFHSNFDRSIWEVCESCLKFQCVCKIVGHQRRTYDYDELLACTNISVNAGEGGRQNRDAKFVISVVSHMGLFQYRTALILQLGLKLQLFFSCPIFTRYSLFELVKMLWLRKLFPVTDSAITFTVTKVSSLTYSFIIQFIKLFDSL